MWKLKVAQGDDPLLITTNKHIGRQYWEFDPNGGTLEERAQVERARQEFTNNRFHAKQSADLLMRMQLTRENPVGPIPAAIRLGQEDEVTQLAVTTSLRRAISFYSSLQAHDGHWPAESAGPIIFLPPFVIALYITKSVTNVLSPEHQKEIIRYLYNHQNEDGGWGLHVEGQSTIFGSTLSYVALRLMGEQVGQDEAKPIARGRQWILKHGGAQGIPSWGKFWLSLLGVYEWAGCNPIPPELLLLPESFPFHSGKMLCYSRMVYMPLSYLYGKRFVGEITVDVRYLREEIFTEPYHLINWSKARSTCAPEDLYKPPLRVQNLLWGFLHKYIEPVLGSRPLRMLRNKALNVAIEKVHYEDQNNRYIGCVDKALSLVACWVEGETSIAFRRHLARVPDFLWLAEDGMKWTSFASQTWDAAFAVQAIISSNLTSEYSLTLRKAHNFIKESQVQEDPSGEYSKMYRHKSKGAWTFTIRDHGWQVSDCTAEALKAALLMSLLPHKLVGKRIKAKRLYDAVNVILSLQNVSGGFSPWEPCRTFSWMENFSPVEFSGDIFIEREYVECTSSSIQGLRLFRKLHPEYREEEIENAISKGIRYIKINQNRDGSWGSSWGICYTYGTWMAVEALVRETDYHYCPTLRKACKFLISKQLPDGGWGESYLSSTTKVYTNLPGNRSNLVQTSWALLALIEAGQDKIDPTSILRGIRLLINSQMEDGDFPQQDTTGVAMPNIMMNYSSYRNIFPIWALGKYREKVQLYNAQQTAAEATKNIKILKKKY